MKPQVSKRDKIVKGVSNKKLENAQTAKSSRRNSLSIQSLAEKFDVLSLKNEAKDDKKPS